MKILIATVGSRGDVQPYVALGMGLAARGHVVTVCTSSRFRSFVEGRGLGYAYMNNDLLDLLESDEGREAIESMTNPWGTIQTARKLMKKLAPTMRAMLAEGWEAAQKTEPDLMVFHPKVASCIHYAEKLGVPAVMGLLCPQMVPTREFPSVGFPEWKLGGSYNRLTYAIVSKVSRLVGGKHIRKWRSSHGMAPLPRGADLLHAATGEPIPIMHAHSRHVLSRPSDWPESSVVTGYWFLDRQDDWSPPTVLEEFLESGDPPVYVGFGSMSGRRPERVTRIVIEALRRSKRRGIIATGWGGLVPDELPETIHKIDSAPHDWLFPRVSAVVHHGGAGTTAAGLRAGRPTVICPFFGDQPFWGRRVHDLGAGCAPIPQKKMTVDNLSDAIVEATTNPGIRKSAESVGSAVRREDGISVAAAFIDGIIRARSPARSVS